MESILRNAIARIDIMQNGRSASRGTGFLVGDGLVLTALHVVADRTQLSLAPYPGEIVLTFPGGTVKAAIDERYWDRLADWALLRCPSMPSIRPLPFAELRDDGMNWETYGFPDANPGGMAIGGRVTDHHGALEGNPALQLFSQEAAAGLGAPVRGLSGSPVIVQNAVVGLLRFALMKEGQTVAGTVYACPVTCVLQKTGDLLPLPDPCFGLPGLPRQPLPAEPFRNLAWFTAREAEVFFGRNREIRQMYERLTAEDGAPIVLLYGQSGVGKSSFLDAGLLPRLARYHQVAYLRRDAHSTLLETVRGQLDRLGGEAAESAVDLAGAWQAAERNGGKPLVLFFDQVEEVYTHASADAPEELTEFARELGRLFAVSNAPQGRLVLSFRKEWLSDVQKQMEANSLPYTKVFLEGLDRPAVIGAITGLTFTERLREFYNLTIDPGLPERIAADLLSDAESPIAPTLQILLTKLWGKAAAQSRSSPIMTAEQYLGLKQEGLLLGDFLDQQQAALRTAHDEWVESGLALDVLACHTTSSLTANECSLDELLTTYKHRAADIPPLLQELQDLFLLSDSSPDDSRKATRLCHDTLAVVVRQRYVSSIHPGQRARRIIEGRVDDWVEGSAIGLLDDGSLETVEGGAAGMRRLRPKEEKLIEASRALQRERREQRKWLKIAGALAAALILAAAVTAGVEWRSANRTAQEEHKQEVIAKSEAQEAIQQKKKAEDEKREADDQKAEAVRQQSRADLETMQARMQLAISDGLRFLGSQPDQALLPAIAAVGYGHDLGQVDIHAQALLYRAINEARIENVFPTGITFGSWLDWSKDGRVAVFGVDAAAKNPTFSIDLYDPSGKRLGGSIALPEGVPTLYPIMKMTSGSIAKFSPDGKFLAAAGLGIWVWDQSGKLVFSVPPSIDTQFHAVAFTPDPPAGLGSSQEARLLLASSLGGKVTAWNTANWKMLWETPGTNTKLLTSVAAGWPKPVIVSTGGEQSVTLWGVDGKRIGILPVVLQVGVRDFDMTSGSSTRIALQSGADIVDVFDGTSGPPRQIRLLNQEVCGFKFNPRGDLLAIAVLEGFNTSAGASGSVRFKNPSSGEDALPPMKDAFRIGDGDCPSLAFSPSGDRLALRTKGSADEPPKIQMIDVNGPLLPTRFQTGRASLGRDCCELAFSPDGSSLAATIAFNMPDGHIQEELSVWNLRNGSLRRLPTRSGVAVGLVFSPDSKLVAAGYYDGYAGVWKATGEPVKPISQVATRLSNIGFNSDGSRLLLETGIDTPHKLTSWNFQGNEAPGAVPQSGDSQALKHAANTSRQAVSPDGSLVYSADSTVNVSVRATGEKIAAFGTDAAGVSHLPEALQVALSPDGKTVASLNADGSIRLWRATWREWLEVACGRARNLAKGDTENAKYVRSVCQQMVWSRTH